jgi:hypothetical protein
MLQVKLEPQEIQFVIQAINNVQIYGKDAHTVSSILRKFEEKIENLQEVKQ